ncbi:hypothetical protein HDV03_004773 [Kappamyces sp. JEL0829]|nr:hypothetical protein HDV03_004773 [Kappamyces sp. JEL0829]
MTLQDSTATQAPTQAPEASSSAEAKPRVIEHVVPGHETFQPRRVICLPVDESKGSLQAIRWTIDKLVDKDADQVLLLNVRNYLTPDYSLSLGYPYTPFILPAEQAAEMEESARKHSHGLLISYAKEFQKLGIHVRAVALQGDARDCLTHKINTVLPTMVVMSNRGLGVLSQALLGSVSQHIVHHSRVPVLIVPYAE